MLESIFVFILAISLTFITIRLFYYSSLSILLVIEYLALIGIITILIFLAYYDIRYMEVQGNVSFALLAFLLILNFLLYTFLGSDGVISIGDNWQYSPYQNFISTITLGAIFLLIFLLSRKKGLGDGDIRMSIVIGLLIGFQNILLWSYITVFSALLYGLILVFKKRKIKGLKIPFVPFMVLGCITIILLSL
ncbi:MAG: prepilin peptidase [Candidatus Dojkabacteria bacterium]|nr:prepilin peptidase [Candidatus Dojkabacteria bacterium]